MVKNILVVVIAFLFFGCSAIKQGKIENGIERALEVTELICSTGKVLEHAAEECAAIVGTAKCVETYDAETVEFIQCIDDIDGIELLAEKISKQN